MDLSTLVKMSNTYGSNPAYVLAGGGNTSVKDDTTLYVKGSGTQLATIKAEEFVKMDRARLNEIMKTEYPADDVKRESAYLADVMAAVTDDDKTKRPSVEALLHNLFAYTYVLHVHPTLVNGLTCGKGAQTLCEQLLGKEVLWIDICKPGYTLARICYEKMNAYKEEFGKDVQVLLLQNHGIFVAANTVEEIGVLFDGVINKLEKQVTDFETVQVAMVQETSPNPLFSFYIEQVKKSNSDLLNIQEMDESAALAALKSKKISGIYYNEMTPSLTVNAHGIPESILQSILENYNNSLHTIQNILKEHPSGILNGLSQMADTRDLVQELSLGGKTIDGNSQFFYALIAMACL